MKLHCKGGKIHTEPSILFLTSCYNHDGIQNPKLKSSNGWGNANSIHVYALETTSSSQCGGAEPLSRPPDTGVAIAYLDLTRVEYSSGKVKVEHLCWWSRSSSLPLPCTIQERHRETNVGRESPWLCFQHTSCYGMLQVRGRIKGCSTLQPNICCSVLGTFPCCVSGPRAVSHATIPFFSLWLFHMIAMLIKNEMRNAALACLATQE